MPAKMPIVSRMRARPGSSEKGDLVFDFCRYVCMHYPVARNKYLLIFTMVGGFLFEEVSIRVKMLQKTSNRNLHKHTKLSYVNELTLLGPQSSILYRNLFLLLLSLLDSFCCSFPFFDLFHFIMQTFTFKGGQHPFVRNWRLVVTTMCLLWYYFIWWSVNIILFIFYSILHSNNHKIL